MGTRVKPNILEIQMPWMQLNADKTERGGGFLFFRFSFVFFWFSSGFLRVFLRSDFDF